MIKGIVFDFDGTILDSEVSIHQAWLEIYKEFNVSLPFDLWASTIGTAEDYFDPISYLETKIGRKLDAGQLRKKQAELEREILRNTEPLPGVLDYLEQAKQNGLVLGIASSSSREWVETNLQVHGLREYFVTVITQEDVPQTKPYPYLFEKAVKAMKLFPYQVIAIEDSPLGVTAAQAAGIFTIAVPNQLTRHLNISHADMVLNSLAEISLDDLILQISV
jgi:HAD superfamily hydrolase (TIGR01509 family)